MPKTVSLYLLFNVNENAETGFFCGTALSTQDLNKVVRSKQTQNKTVSGTQYERVSPLYYVILTHKL